MKRIIGIMTGNSLDAVDVVLTEFSDQDEIHDIAGLSVPYPISLRNALLTLRCLVNEDDIDMDTLQSLPLFLETHDSYLHVVSQAVLKLLSDHQISPSSIDAIGFHGQTLDHCGPSLCPEKNDFPYTLQMGSGQKLADLTGIPVIYDFRSDEIISGGEGAPLVPPHNKHIAEGLGLKSAVFYNAGNTSNLAIVTEKTLLGWDAGPFNEFTDKLIRRNTSDPYDENGKYGSKGKLKPELLRELFEKSARTPGGHNFYLVKPPRSGDPRWYQFEKIAAFQNPVDFNDVVYTSEYFAAYTAVFTLQFVPKSIELPNHFILFGGGWHNPVCFNEFKKLLSGDGYVLPQHKSIFKQICTRFKEKPAVYISDLGKYMEARLFADLARYYLEKKTWTTYELTGCKTPVVLGTMRRPFQGLIDDRISRAAKGWQKKERKVS